MRKKLSLILVLLLIVGLAPKANASNSPFSDVPVSHWAYHEIMEAYNDGVMTGTAPGVFSPSGTLSINQFFTVLTRAFYNEEVLNSKRFGDWPNQNFDVAEKHKLFTGITSWLGVWDITREMMAQMMYNVMVDQCLAMPDGVAAKGRIPDFATVGGDYRDAVTVCYEMGLLTGVDGQGNFNPEGNLDRAQTAVIYTRLKKAINGLPVDPEAVIRKNTRYLTNGMPVMEENVLALMEEYRNGKEPGERAKQAGFTSYEDLAEYDAYNPPYTIMDFGSGTECAKFALAFWDDLFGTDAFMHKVASYADIRPGDLIEWGGHWSIAMERPYYEIDFDGVGHWVVHHVGAGGGLSGACIGWGGNPWSVDGDNIIAAYTRYPD